MLWQQAAGCRQAGHYQKLLCVQQCDATLRRAKALKERMGQTERKLSARSRGYPSSRALGQTPRVLASEPSSTGRPDAPEQQDPPTQQASSAGESWCLLSPACAGMQASMPSTTHAVCDWCLSHSQCTLLVSRAPCLGGASGSQSFQTAMLNPLLVDGDPG